MSISLLSAIITNWWRNSDWRYLYFILALFLNFEFLHYQVFSDSFLLEKNFSLHHWWLKSYDEYLQISSHQLKMLPWVICKYSSAHYFFSLTFGDNEVTLIGRIPHMKRSESGAESGLGVCIVHEGTSHPGKLWATAVFEAANNEASCSGLGKMWAHTLS